ncbi:hypothetical protein T4A_2654 [Trichinella pseudospiralis]|uniref:Uncharacterized protein n=1 Tax=Trichinella pseudospiralis TaxID=6337 RepID=A0A0V1DXS2_TRIPS|nr:hypothetical protein T4A_2654 [Trichinella pseudospiralis]
MKQGISEPVESERNKGNGSVMYVSFKLLDRDCGDFRVTINEILLIESHLNLTFEDLTMTQLSRITSASAILHRNTGNLLDKLNHVRIYRVTYFIHRIHADGIHTTTERIKAIPETPSPKNH